MLTISGLRRLEQKDHYKLESVLESISGPSAKYWDCLIKKQKQETKANQNSQPRSLCSKIYPLRAKRKLTFQMSKRIHWISNLAPQKVLKGVSLKSNDNKYEAVNQICKKKESTWTKKLNRSVLRKKKTVLMYILFVTFPPAWFKGQLNKAIALRLCLWASNT